MGQRLAIFEVDHSSSPVLKIAATFFDSTSSAAVSANARSLRRSSRSSSLMRRRSCCVCCGLARASSGSASACVALCRQEASSCGYTPLARHHALLAASSIAAVVSTASNRAAAVQASSRAGLDSASLRQRSSVPTPTPTSRATSSNAALSGGSNRATALSLNACPYFANSFSHHRPRFMDSIGATSILTRGGCSLPGPRNASLSNPRKLSLCKFLEFLVQQRDAQLHDTVCFHATPAHMLALAHSTANYSVNRRFDEAGGDSPSHTLPSAIVDQRLNVALEIRDHIREAVACVLDLATVSGGVNFT